MEKGAICLFAATTTESGTTFFVRQEGLVPEKTSRAHNGPIKGTHRGFGVRIFLAVCHAVLSQIPPDQPFLITNCPSKGGDAAECFVVHHTNIFLRQNKFLALNRTRNGDKRQESLKTALSCGELQGAFSAGAFLLARKCSRAK